MARKNSYKVKTFTLPDGSRKYIYGKTKKEVEYTLVSSNEVDFWSGKISDQSPVGAALIGHRKGDTVVGTVEASGYTFRYRILNVTRD